MALLILLQGCEPWVIGEQEESMITSAKYVMGPAKYTWQDYKPNKYIFSELKINPVLTKIQNYVRKWIQHVRRLVRGRSPELITKCQPREKRGQSVRV